MKNLKSVLSSEAWRLIKESIIEKINEIEEEILEDDSPINNKPAYTKHSLLKKHRKLLKDIIENPYLLLEDGEEMQVDNH